MTIDVMIDLEFMAKPPLATICTIGAVAFNIETGEITDEFYQRVEWRDGSQDLPLNPDTIAWWMGQSPKACEEILASDERMRLAHALQQFDRWMAKVGFGPYDTIWGNGDDCDCVILEGAYSSCTIPTPWQFWQTRDVRTVVDLCRRIRGKDCRQLVDGPDIAHHALHDARYQAQYVSRAYRLLAGQV